ncbi:MAG: hypothetical protein WCP31_09285, partial [Chloroflexales bacterium]
MFPMKHLLIVTSVVALTCLLSRITPAVASSGHGFPLRALTETAEPPTPLPTNTPLPTTTPPPTSTSINTPPPINT